MKKIVAMILVLLIFCSACSADKTEVVEINPLSENAVKDSSQVTLYFKNIDHNALVSEFRTIEASLNERIEVAILKELISGPSAINGEMEMVINPATKVVNISDNGGFLFVTLSKEFLEPFNMGNIAQQDAQAVFKNKMRLAVYSIVNTLIEYSCYSRVQILVDKDGSGNGKRIQLAEVGFDGEGTLEPLAWNGEVVLTCLNTVTLLFDETERKDWESVYKYIAYNDSGDTQKPVLSDFINTISALGITLENYEIEDCILSQGSNTAIVIMNYSIKAKEAESRQKTNIPIRLIKENNIWKIQYSVFKNLLISE